MSSKDNIEIDFEPCSCYLLSGKSKSGKSYLMKYLITSKAFSSDKYKFGIVFTTSGIYNDDYDFLPKKSVREFNEDTFKAWFDHLKSLKERYGDNIPRNFIVFDDLMGVLSDSNLVKNFISSYRHWGTDIYIAVQYVASSASSTLLRQQVNYAFIFRDSNMDSLKYLYKAFGQQYDKLTDFKTHLNKATEEQFSSCLYIRDELDRDKNYLSFLAPPPKILGNIKLNF
jgi:hypothetical protein